MNSFRYLSLVVHVSYRSNYQLILAIISPANCCDNLTIKFGDRFTNTQDVCILFFSVTSNQARNVAVVNRINDVPMLVANRPIYHNMDKLTYQAFYFLPSLCFVYFASVVLKSFIFMGVAEANLLKHMLATGILQHGICINCNHSQFLKCVLKNQSFRLGAITLFFNSIVLQMNAHTALTLLKINALQLTFANDSVANHDRKQLPICNGISVKVAVRNFRSIDIFIIMHTALPGGRWCGGERPECGLSGRSVNII